MSIRIGTAERDSTFLGQGRALKTVLDRDPRLAPVAVLESPHASVDNANRLHAGALDFGFMAANWIGRAREGSAPFRQPIDLRMVAPMNAGPLFFIARAESPIRSVADLRGRRVAIGARQSGMAQHAEVILAALGLSLADLTLVYLDFAAGADALASDAVDAQLQCPIPNKVMSELSQRIDIRVLPYAAGQLEAVLSAVPFYRRTVMRKDALRGLDADVAQAAVVNVLVAHARLDDATAGAVARTIVAARDELPRLDPLFAGLADLFAPLRSEGAAALEFGGVKLHPGALAAYRELGLVR
jgi:TRAP transporter TAXI family solute receptor